LDASCRRPLNDSSPVKATEAGLLARNTLFVPKSTENTRDTGLRTKTCQDQLKDLFVRPTGTVQPVGWHHTIEGGFYSLKVGESIRFTVPFHDGPDKMEQRPLGEIGTGAW
jgi:hypothetical protein